MLSALSANLRDSKLFPCAAIKVFRRGAPSGNLLFGGSKTGQRETDFFAHCMCTNLTEQASMLLKPVISTFRKFSEYPLSLGISEFAALEQNGEAAEPPVFPWALVLRPVPRFGVVPQHFDKYDGFIDDCLDIQPGTTIYEVFGCPSPAAAASCSSLQRLGRLVTTSEVRPSGPDDGLFFKHQRKEEDYELQPSWLHELQVPCEDETHSGSVGTVAGWKLFEKYINAGGWVDFEK
jgi:hypothetical protein